MLGLILGLLSCVHGTAQFVVERSPWLDGEAVTEEPVHQTWAVADQSTAQLIQAELTVEGLNLANPWLRVDEDTTLKLAPTAGTVGCASSPISCCMRITTPIRKSRRIRCSSNPGHWIGNSAASD